MVFWRTISNVGPVFRGKKKKGQGRYYECHFSHSMMLFLKKRSYLYMLIENCIVCVCACFRVRLLIAERCQKRHLFASGTESLSSSLSSPMIPLSLLFVFWRKSLWLCKFEAPPKNLKPNMFFKIAPHSSR